MATRASPINPEPVIAFSPTRDGDAWRGADWTITNEHRLAELIALIAIGQYRHVRRILHETGVLSVATTQTIKDGAIRLLTANDPQSPWQRDGWLFQAISWIAAHLHDPTTLKSAPHIIPAQKGFDQLHLRLDAPRKTVLCAVVCEDKATTTPRKTIREEVWPAFQQLESGQRDHVIVSEISTLLATESDLDAEQAIARIFWKRARAYRVAITIGAKEHSDPGRQDLFQGYAEKIAGGEPSRRRAETLYQEDLRAWLEKMARMAIDAVNAMALI